MLKETFYKLGVINALEKVGTTTKALSDIVWKSKASPERLSEFAGRLRGLKGARLSKALESGRTSPSAHKARMRMGEVAEAAEHAADAKLIDLATQAQLKMRKKLTQK